MTLTSRLPDCPVGTTCRQRQNLDLARVRGFESELELRLAREWRLLASYRSADARIVDASQQPGLEGKRLAQVPEHATLTARYVGDQYEDDLNTLPLGSYVVVDLLAVENLLDRIFTTGRSSEGVISTGEPRMARAGLRLGF